MASKKNDTETKEKVSKTKKTAEKKETAKKTSSKKVSASTKKNTVKKEADIVSEVKEEVIETKPEVSEKTELLQVPDSVVKDALKQVNKAAKKQARQEFLSKVVEELIAFLFLVIIICLVIFGVGYWYKNYYVEREDQVEAQEQEKLNSEYRIVSYSSPTGNISVLNDNYVIDYNKDNSKVTKILDRELNTLFEGELEVTKVIPSTDGTIYAYLDEDAESENLVTLYKLVDGEFEKIKEIGTLGYYFSPIVYTTNGNNSYLLGFYGEENSDATDSVIYNLNGDKSELHGYSLVGDYNRSSSDAEIRTRNKNYIVAKSLSSKRYGLYNLNDNQLTFEALYDELHCTFDDNFVAKKDNYTGILNIKSKKVVDFQYDFIDIQKGYYVVSKDNKLAIMDSDFKLLTGFDFDYQTNNYYKAYSYTKANSFVSYKINDMYLLVTNNNEKSGSYNKHTAYLIKNSGAYTEIVETYIEYDKDSNFLYSYDDNTDVYTIYEIDNENILNSYEISLNGYILNNVTISKYNDEIVRINNDIYINFKTNEEVEGLTYTKDYSFDTYKVSLDYENAKGLIYTGDVITSTYKCNSKDNYVVREDNTFYIILENDYISIEKIS